MSNTPPSFYRTTILRWVIVLLFVAFGFVPLSPAYAGLAPATSLTPTLELLHTELETLQGQTGLYSIQAARRLADLSRLETAIADSTDHPTIDNASSHQLGVIIRNPNKNSPEPTVFTVLAAGHQTDDDADSLALYIPANVPLRWPGQFDDSISSLARVIRLLPGENLRVTDSQPGAGLLLDLPPYSLDTDFADLGDLPFFNQKEIDALPESAPVD